MRYVYIIKGPHNRVYVGITKKDLKQKLEEHRNGVDSVKIESPFSLIYAYQTKSELEAKQKKAFIKALFKAKCLTFSYTKEMMRYARPYT